MAVTDQPEPKPPPCTTGYDHPAEGWLVSPEGRRVRPLCSKHADQLIRDLAGVFCGHWWFEPL